MVCLNLFNITTRLRMCGNEEKQISWKNGSRCAFDAAVLPAVGRSNGQNKI
jgi:hypothetical protein